ncbi:hypothetical protein CRUP_032034 [Coryphaenoides rupestris]|nr:hypothetical protein CRUP_032034 [Coryphaenoides rupestris]
MSERISKLNSCWVLIGDLKFLQMFSTNFSMNSLLVSWGMFSKTAECFSSLFRSLGTSLSPSSASSSYGLQLIQAISIIFNMANQLKIPLHGKSVHIVQQYGPEIKDVLQRKYDVNVDVIGMGHSFGQARNPPMAPERRFYTQLKTIKVFVWKDDLTRFKVDAVVNAANEGLDHCGGLANALSVAGGPDIQSESYKHIERYGPVQTGEVFVGNAGRLPCQKIIHAVGPCLPFAPTRDEVSNAEPLLERAVIRILQTAEEYKLKSVAIPALSSGLFNFPVNKCADIIVGVLARYDSRGYSCEIHLVNNDEPTVKEMERACIQKFGSATTPVSHGVQSKRDETYQAPLTVQMGNIQLTVRKGYIERQNTDVIVNTTGTNLDLSKGAVSNAILYKAGKEMQKEINKQQSKLVKQAIPHVLQTKPYGLSCKQDLIHLWHPNYGL